MHYFLLLVVVVITASSVIPINEAAQDGTLAQVLKEYLRDIQLAEAASKAKCSAPHRNRLSKAQNSLKKEMDFCKFNGKCLEDRTKAVVSEIRSAIIDLKNCVDHS